MKKLLFLIIVIVAIGAYFAINKTKKESVIFSSTLPLANSEGVTIGSYMLQDIIDLNLPYQCVMNKYEETHGIGANIFISDKGDVRADFDIEVYLPEGSESEQPRNFASHIITKEGEAYVWTSLDKVGYIAPIAKNASRKSNLKDQGQIIGTEEYFDYECKPWNANLTIFNIPNGITFVR